MVNTEIISELFNSLNPELQEKVEQIAAKMVTAKEAGEKIVVVTGSGPNIHEGVTTLIAELIHKGIIDGVTTSSAVVNHELSGSLEKVHRVDGRKVGFSADKLPLDRLFESCVMSDEDIQTIEKEMPVDRELMALVLATEGNTIIKAAGNMAYPLGLRTERLAREIEALAKANGLPFETVAGAAADPMTMLGAGYRKNVPVLVSVPQLIGGGAVGLAVGDSISITERTMRIAKLMDSASIIIESAVALTQEIHDGPFERYTGHGIWADWEGYFTYSLAGKTLVRIDLDPNLELAWKKQRESNIVQDAIAKGLPKTKLTGVPFRMEMSGFSRLPGSIPVIADIGTIWPILAFKVTQKLGIKLDFISYPQSTPAGQAMREWIVHNVKFADRERMYAEFRK
ncbi:MAG TPA: hypothetical protein GX391_05405 [Firmicutes bacterium]|nr:hypothetical protein [Bacillota bacterium]HOQ24905.1 hypothetical protein [Bacillota bacterium]HPT68075.1 hypothetical protein [Bacillota bacterium]